MDLQEVDKLKILSFQYIEKNYSNHITIPEVTMNGGVADLLSINGEIHIFELKSKKDSLTRLKNQIISFKKGSNRTTIIADEKFKDKLISREDMDGIGIIIVDSNDKFIEVKKAEYREIEDVHSYLNYWSPIELRETLRGLKGWYKLSTFEAMTKIITILNLDEIRRLSLFRLKEKYENEYKKRLEFIRNKEYKNALNSRYEDINSLKITPLIDIPISIFKDFD